MQVANVNGRGRALRLRTAGLYLANGDAYENTAASLNALASVAHSGGVIVVEEDGRHMPVKAKWLLNVLAEGLPNMSARAQQKTLKRMLGVARRTGRVFITRKMISFFQADGSE